MILAHFEKKVNKKIQENWTKSIDNVEQAWYTWLVQEFEQNVNTILRGGVLMMYDYSKLLGRIKEHCGSQAVFSSLMKISERTVSSKLNNKKEWKQSEKIKACEILKIKKSEIPIFFYSECSRIWAEVLRKNIH